MRGDTTSWAHARTGGSTITAAYKDEVAGERVEEGGAETMHNDEALPRLRCVH